MILDLSLSKNYVSNWGLNEAVREIVQNAIDQETFDSENEFNWDYFPESKELRIMNKSSVLERNSVLLGNSTKSDDKFIGKFGEGYKLALLVLTRLSKKVTILNYGKKEIWTCMFKNSVKFKSEILCIEIKKKVFTRVPDHNLTYIIEDISIDEFNDLSKSILHFGLHKEGFDTEYGRILTEDDQVGRVYVSGLLVTSDNVDKLHCGYDLKPGTIKLDRDRRMVESFHLKWVLSKVVAQASEKFLTHLIKNNAPEVELLEHTMAVVNNGVVKSSSDSLYKHYEEKHGKDFIPVSSQEESEKYSGNKVIVTGTQNAMIRSSVFFSEPVEKIKQPYDYVKEAYNEFKVGGLGLLDFEKLLEMSKNWKLK